MEEQTKLKDKASHPQEKIVETFYIKGNAEVDIVEWTQTIWCGKIGYASDNKGEPDVDKIMSGYQSLDFGCVNRAEDDWDVCVSVNYLSKNRPNGVMFAFLYEKDDCPADFDILKVPASVYARIRICDETAAALGCEPWRGGIPPYNWIGEEIAPLIGYKYGCDTLPVFEYYGFYNPEKNSHEFCYLYVPVEKI